jgi:hypothetical protein
MVGFPNTAPSLSSLFPRRDASDLQPERSSAACARRLLAPAVALEDAALVLL